MASTTVAFAQTPRPVRKGKAVQITIRSIPDGAELYLDGKEYGLVAYTPWKSSLVKGQYTVILELPGYKTASVPIDVTKKGQEFAIPLEKLAAPATVQVLAGSGDSSATGANVWIDGVHKGVVPAKAEIAAGRHQVLVRKEGFDLYGEWVDLKPGETRTMAIVLKKSTVATPKGSVLVTADADDAEVFVDGSAKGTVPLVVGDLEPGPHVFEVKKAGMTPWSQTVMVVAGQTVKVAASLKSQAPQAGSLRVLSNVTGAEVYLDGELKGQAPVAIPNVTVGSHIVEVKAEGYELAEQTVTIAAGQEQVIKLTLTKAAATTGRLAVTLGEHPDAEVSIDGTVVGTGSVEREVNAGRHVVRVRKSGYYDWEQAFEVSAGGVIPVVPQLALKIVAPPVVTPPVVTPAPGGDDGTVDGPGAGAGGRKLTPAEQEALLESRRLTSFGARTIKPGKFTADISVGYPYAAEGRLSVGGFDKPSLGLDVSIEARFLFLQEYELGLMSRLRLFDKMPLAGAAFAQMGGGDGRNGRNTFYTNLGAVASLTFQDKITFSARAYLNMYSDRLCPELDSMGSGDPDEAEGCHLGGERGAEQVRVKEVTGEEYAEIRGRDNGARFMLSAILEIAYSQKQSFFVIFEGPPFQGERAKFIDLFNSPMATEDYLTYLRVGLTLKF